MATLDPQIRERLTREFNVTENECDDYNRIYETNILPRIRKKYLAHMVSSVEEMIDEVIRAKEKSKKPEEPPKQEAGNPTVDQPKQEAGSPKVRRYSIVLSDRNPPKNGKSFTWSLPQGAIITYEPNNEQKDLRIFVAHELGHLLIEHGILPGKNSESQANLLAFCAINGKNEFYKNDAPNLVYKGAELEIIEKIKNVCLDSQKENAA